MHPVQQTLVLLRRRPLLWLPQAIAAVINLLLNTASTTLAQRLGRHYTFAQGALFTHGLTLRTPDMLVASEAVKVPPVLLSRFVQYFLVVAAIAITAALLRAPRLGIAGAAAWVRRQRSSAVLATALLVAGLTLADYMFYIAIQTAFSYVPALRPSPAWLLLVLMWASDLACTAILYLVAVPWALALTLPPAHHTLSSWQKNSARLALFLGWTTVEILHYLWSRVEGHWLPARVEPGPVWHAPITIVHPLLNLCLLAFLSVFAAVLTGNHVPPEHP